MSRTDHLERTIIRLFKEDQFVDIRNGIRRGWSAGQIALKEGEAAALWFYGDLKTRSAAAAPLPRLSDTSATPTATEEDRWLSPGYPAL